MCTLVHSHVQKYTKVHRMIVFDYTFTLCTKVCTLKTIFGFECTPVATDDNIGRLCIRVHVLHNDKADCASKCT